MIEILLELGAKVTVGECSGVSWRPTLKVFNKLNLYELTRRLGVELIAFEEKHNEWVRIAINGDGMCSIFPGLGGWISKRENRFPRVEC